MTDGPPTPLRVSDSEREPQPGLWHVRLTVAGPSVAKPLIAKAFRRLAQQSPFLTSIRYDSSHAEVSYWDEADDLDDVAAMALRMWSDHRGDAGLPDWRTTGLEVLERETFLVRGSGEPHMTVTGDVRPF